MAIADEIEPLPNINARVDQASNTRPLVVGVVIHTHTARFEQVDGMVGVVVEVELGPHW